MMSLKPSTHHLPSVLSAVSVIIVYSLLFLCDTSSAQTMTQGYKVPHKGGYLIVAPRKIRATSVYSVHVSIYKMYSTYTYVRATLSQDGVEYAREVRKYLETGSKTLDMLVPEYVGSGDHKLTVEGLADERIGQPLFSNTTDVEFVSKNAALFIMTDKYLYYPEQTAFVRVIATDQYLYQKHGVITAYVRDAKGNIIWRWLSEQLNFGIFSGEFKITYPINEGAWEIEVDAFGHIYKKEFRVELFYKRRFEVNVTMPIYVTEKEFGIEGQFYGEHQSGQLSKGNCTILAKMLDERGEYEAGEIERKIGFFDHAIPFMFPLRELRDTWGDDLAGKSLWVKVWVHDWDWTETQNSTAVTRIIRDGIVVHALGPRHRTFKPGFPFTSYFAVMHTDGSPYLSSFYRQVSVQVTHESERGAKTDGEERVIIPDDNILRVQVLPRTDDIRIKIRVWHRRFPDVFSDVLVYRYHSPKGVYLSITSSTEQPEVNKYMVFNLRSTESVEVVNYIIISGGTIVVSDTLRMRTRQTTFSIAASRQMVPHARIIVFYEHSGGDTIADAMNFQVRDTRLSRVNLQVNYGKDFSRDTIELIARGDPGSYVTTSGSDHELYRRGAATFLTEQDIIDELATFDGTNQRPYNHVWYYNSDEFDKTVYFPSDSNGMDALTTFEAAGMFIFTDRNMTADPYERTCNSTLGFGLCPNGQCYELIKKCDGVPDCADGFDEVVCPFVNSPRRPMEINQLHRIIRYYNSMEWLWKQDYIKYTGTAELELYPPEATDPYVISAVVMHPVHGLSIVDGVAQHDVTRDFYMVVEAPETSRRGEQIGVRTSVFNNLDERIEVLMVLHGDDSYRFVMVEDGGYVESYDPKTKGGDIQVMVLLYAGTSKYIHFPVVPTEGSGDVTVRITAYTFKDRDEEEITISVRYDGCANADQTPYLIDLVNQGSQFIPALQIAIPVEFIHPEDRSHLWIPGSAVATVSLFGDVVSPGFTDGEPLDMANTIGLPHDSADGYMFEFGLNMETLLYLRDTDALPPNIDKVLNYMRSILMRQFSYMQDDGSYKLFRRDPNPSLWVTAFSIRWLHEAFDSEWREELYMDSDTLSKTAQWITLQQTDQGSFADPTAVLHDRKMNPVSIDEDGVSRTLNISLTAYVTIQLSYLTRIRSYKSEVDNSKRLGANYLAENMYLVTDPFQMSLIAFALHKSGHIRRSEAFGRLKSMRFPGGDYWADIEIGDNPSHFQDTIPILEPRPDWTNMGSAVMATSYAMMMYIANDQINDTIPLMKWIQTQRSSLFGWSSTQDTLVALEALKDFALTEKNRFIYNMQVEIQNTQNPGWTEYYNMNADTFANEFSVNVPFPHGEVRAYASGTGYAIINLVGDYNVELPELMTNSGFDIDPFVVELESMSYSGRNASIVDARFCAQWNRPDLDPLVGMVMLAIEVPSGYVVARDSIEAVYNSHVPGLRRVRFRDNTIFTIWESMTTQRTCFEFRAERWYPIANISIQYMMNTHEYAEAGSQWHTLYSSYTLHHLHICQVCGSFQCPYCPDYNIAAVPVSSVWLMTSLAVISLLFVLPYHRGLEQMLFR